MQTLFLQYFIFTEKTKNEKTKNAKQIQEGFQSRFRIFQTGSRACLKRLSARCITIYGRFRSDEGAGERAATRSGEIYRKVGRADCGNFQTRSSKSQEIKYACHKQMQQAQKLQI